ncbi:B3 domain-containing transcription factor VRN1-like protein [Drosera capensis]
MANRRVAQNRRRRTGGSEPGQSEQRTWRFFKLILPPILDEKRLCIPRKFIQHFVNEIPAMVTLVVPTGDSWDVAVTTGKNKMWFSQGWESFAEFYSLSVGSFLLFGYKRGSSFTVNVFDITGCEIKYPLFYRATPSESHETSGLNGDCEEVRQERDPVQYVDLLTDSDTEAPGQQSAPDEHHGTDSDSAVNVNVNSSFGCSPPLPTGSEGFPKFVRHDSFRADFVEGRSGQSLRTMDAMKAAQMADTKNPHFIAEMRERNTTFLHLNRYFSLKYLRSDMRNLQLLSNGREWYAECDYRPDICLAKGWDVFWHENNLKVGDVCVFELLDAANPVMNLLKLLRSFYPVVIHPVATHHIETWVVKLTRS